MTDITKKSLTQIVKAIKTKVSALDPNIVPKATSVNKPINHDVVNPILFGTANIQ